MTEAGFVNANLWRKALRTILLIFAIFIAFLLFGVLMSLQRAFYSQVEASSDRRLVTVNAINFTASLPIAYVQRVRQVDGVTGVSHMVWHGGYYQEPRNFVQTMAADIEGYLDLYPELVIPDDQRADLLANRDGLLVGRALADQYGWEVGDQVPIMSNIWRRDDGTYVWLFTVRAIFEGDAPTVATNYALFHYEYMDEGRAFGEDTIGWMMVGTESSERNDEIIAAIDAMFANSPFETETTTEGQFNEAFAAQFGDIAQIFMLVVGAAFATILLIVGNTMVMAVRERTREIGVLKTLGFSDRRIFGQVLAESLALAFLGGLLGLGAAWMIVTALAPVISGFMPGLALTPQITLAAVALMIGLGVLTGAIPAANAMRLRVIDALGRE